MMTRCLLNIFLMTAVLFFGVLPHAAMAGEPQKSAPCHIEQTVANGHAKMIEDCSARDHSMSGACAIACHGAIAAAWFPDAVVMQRALRPIVHWAAVPLVLNECTDETADRPPKSI